MLNKNNLSDIIHNKTYRRIDVLLILLAVEVDKPKKVQEIKRLGRNAGYTEILKWNISEALKRPKDLAIRLPEGWSLTSKGREHVISLGVLPKKKSIKVVNNTDQIRKEASTIKNPDTKKFVEEAIKAYEGELYRSCVVLSWIGAVSLLYDYVINNCLTAFNKEANRRNAKWKNANVSDNLSRMKESEFLDIIGSPPISVISKDLKEELKNNCLQLRNSCGHPNSFKIGENKTSAHLEVLILNIFAKF